MANYQYVTNGNNDGAVIGRTSTEPLGFFGATPATKQTLTVTTVATTVAVSTTSAIWGFSTSTQANQIIVAVNQLLNLAANLGLGG